MRNRLFRTTSGLSLTIAGLFAAQVVAAQDAKPAEQASVADEVIVTAQKRAENVQNVPQAIQVVTPSALAASGVHEFTDLTKVAPSLVVRPAEQPVNSSVSIRGIGTFAFSIGVEPSVAIQVDDVPVAFQARAFTDLSDIERIEVLRGPQSTLYGKSASAGLINIVTRAPSKDFSADVNAMMTSDAEYSIGGSVSGPVSETLGVRLSVNRDDFIGNARNVYNGKHASGRAFTSLHGKAVWKPTERFTATVGANYVDGSTTVGRPFINLDPKANLRGNALYPPAVFEAGIVVGPSNTDFANNFNGRTDYHDNSQSLKLDYDFGPATLVAVTGHDSYKLKDLLDVDETAVAGLDNQQIGTFKSHQLTQEVRLVSNGNGPLRYTVGGFYADLDYARDFQRGPVFSLARWYATSGSKQYAGFGQLDWEFMPGTTLTGGLRRQHEKVSYTFNDILNNAQFAGSAAESFWTYKAALNHKFSSAVMAYVSFATGHKGQTYDLTTGFNKNRFLAGPVRPEKSKSFEGGIRSQFLDNHLTLNVTGFYTRYTDFQAQGIETLPDGTTNFRLANVGKLRTSGVEIDSSARLSSDLRLSASAAYVDAKITEFPFAQCYPRQTAAQGCSGSPAFQNLAGKRPAQAPKFKFSSDLSYNHPINDNLNAIGDLTYAYQSKMNFSLNQDPYTIQSGYGIMNVSLGVRSPTKHYEISLFVNNLFNKHYYTNMFDQANTYGVQTAVQVLLPRDFKRFAGLRASYHF